MRLFRKFIRQYNHLLGRYKYPVQIISGGALWFSGDILCQSLVMLSDRFSSTEEATTTSPRGKPTQLESKTSGYDWHRATNMTLYGMFFSAPIYAFWYSFLDSMSTRMFSPCSLRAARGSTANAALEKASTPASGSSPLSLSSASNAALHTDLNPTHSRASTRRLWKIIGFKIFADIAIFDPLYLSFFFTVTSKLESKSWHDIKEKLSADFKSTYIVDVIVWFPIQLINFRFVPVMYQALLVQCCNIGWNAFLSFVQHDEKHLPTATAPLVSSHTHAHSSSSKNA